MSDDFIQPGATGPLDAILMREVARAIRAVEAADQTVRGVVFYSDGFEVVVGDRKPGPQTEKVEA